LARDLTARQKRFADYCIAGNSAEEAMCRAGYSIKTAKRYGKALLAREEIADYIKEATDEKKALAIADMEEVSTFWTAVMRDPQEDIKNRIKASELLSKRGDEETCDQAGENPFAGLSTAQLEAYIALLVEK